MMLVLQTGFVNLNSLSLTLIKEIIMNAKQILIKAFDHNSIPSIGYNTQWENGTGYLNGAIRGSAAPQLEPGERVKSLSHDGRKIVMVGTNLGNVVLFERYCGDDSSIVVSNMPQSIKSILNIFSALSPEIVADILGLDINSFDRPNIGHKVNSIMEEFDTMLKSINN